MKGNKVPKKARVRGKGAYLVRSAEGKRASHQSTSSGGRSTESLIESLRAKQKGARGKRAKRAPGSPA